MDRVWPGFRVTRVLRHPRQQQWEADGSPRLRRGSEGGAERATVWGEAQGASEEARGRGQDRSVAVLCLLVPLTWPLGQTLGAGAWVLQFVRGWPPGHSTGLEG